MCKCYLKKVEKMPQKRKAKKSFGEESSSTSSKRKPSNCNGGEDKAPSPWDKASVPQEPGASINGEPIYNSIKLLAEEGFEDVAKLLSENGVTSKVLDRVTEKQLENLGICPLGRRLEAVDCIQKITDRLYGVKIVNDPIHGHIEIHPLCVKIMDTPQFQRLRSIKQLGGTYFVYPGAAHNRFEHSIGVSHLAGQLAESLRQRQPNLDISNTDILCVQIAGLCHDLGHGPFSHMFDGKFLPKARKDKIKHEDLSLKMFDHLVQRNDLYSEFEKHGVTENDRDFIKEQIKGPLKHKSGEWPYKGRGKEKGFLYEIVANKRNGIDVDKWDYFARDCHMLGIKNNFDHERCIKYARVLEVDGELQICSRDKEVGNLYDMFHTRNTLHRRAYQHRVGDIIETMMTEALLLVDEVDSMKIPGTNGKKRKISETVDDMEAYQKLTDSIFDQILWSTDKKLAKAREIMMNIQKRQLYKCVGQVRPPDGSTFDKDKTVEIKNKVSRILKDMKSDLQNEDILIHLVFLDYGMKDKNPIDHVRFYNKGNPNQAIQLKKNEVSDLLPEKFAEQLVRCYCKKRDKASMDQAAEAFSKWSQQQGCTAGEAMTPVKSSKEACQTPALSTLPPHPRGTPASAGKFKSHLQF
ncbi:deoxynucleoside triphosphate triphosphohydrolase SAMHD1-like [Crassostrea virginica]